MNPIILAGNVTVVDTAAKYVLGVIWFDFSTGKAYRYVEGDAALTNDALAAKEVVCYIDDGWEVTNDYSNGLGGGGVAVAGVAISAIGEGEFGWIQVSGQCDVFTDGGVAAGDPLVAHDTDGEADTMGDGEEEQVIGAAIEDDAPNVHVILRGLY